MTRNRRAGPARRSARRETYFVPVEPGVLGAFDDGAPDVVVSLGALGGVARGGGGVVGGDADGVRSIGRSLTRPVSVSVQPAARVAASASAETPKSALFMNAPPDGV